MPRAILPKTLNPANTLGSVNDNDGKDEDEEMEALARDSVASR